MSNVKWATRKQARILKGRAQTPSIDGNLIMCPDILASQILLTGNARKQQVAVLRPRRLRGGYNVTTTSGRFTFVPRISANVLGIAKHRLNGTVEAVIRPVGQNVVAITVTGTTFIVLFSKDSFLAVDRIQQGYSTGDTNRIRVGYAHALQQSGWKAVSNACPFVFNFKERVPALLIPLLSITIRQRATGLASFALSSTDRHDGPAAVMTAPTIAVATAVGAAGW